LKKLQAEICASSIPRGTPCSCRGALATELTFPAIYFFGTKKLQAEKRREAAATELTFPAIYFFGTKKLQAENVSEVHFTQRKA
jgi:hypothetical protein